MGRVKTFRRVCILYFAFLLVWPVLAYPGGPAPKPEGVAEGPHPEHQIFDLGEFQLASGVAVPDFKISFVTHGALNPKKSNAILLSSYYVNDHHGYDFLIGKGLALDPTRYFIVVTDIFAEGISSSPSNTPPPFDGPNFPDISTRDNVKAAYRLVSEQFGSSIW